MATQLGYCLESACSLIGQAHVDADLKTGVASDLGQKTWRLEGENRELKSGGLCFGAELERKHKMLSSSSARTKTTMLSDRATPKRPSGAGQASQKLLPPSR